MTAKVFIFIDIFAIRTWLTDSSLCGIRSYRTIFDYMSGELVVITLIQI